MKNILLAVNAVLVIAVSTLFYLHFSSQSKMQEPIASGSEQSIAKSEVLNEEKEFPKIGYLNVDSLQANYQLYSELINKLKRRQVKYEKELQSKSTAFEKKVVEFQKNAPKMTQFEGQMKQKELGEEEQRLYKMRDDFAIKFKNEELKLNDEFQKNVRDFINSFNQDSKYNLIIGASQVGNIVLDYNESINITDAVVKGLNNQYELNNTPKK
jgi:outer membrane protein